MGNTHSHKTQRTNHEQKKLKKFEKTKIKNKILSKKHKLKRNKTKHNLNSKWTWEHWCQKKESKLLLLFQEKIENVTQASSSVEQATLNWTCNISKWTFQLPTFATCNKQCNLEAVVVPFPMIAFWVNGIINSYF